MTKRGILPLLSFWIVLSLGWNARAEEVRFALAWVPFGKHAFFFATMDRGLYSQEGLSMQLLPGTGAMDAIKKIATGAAEFGEGSVDTLVVARSQGTRVKTLGIYHDKGFHTLYYLKGGGIQQAKDLEGRSIGAPPTQDSRIIFPAFAAKANLDSAKVRWVDMTPAAVGQSLMTGQVDAIASWSIQEPILQRMASEKGKELGAFYYSDYGIDLYSNGILAADDRIRQNPDQVRRFIQATYKGFAWAVEHPEEALQIFLKRNPTSNPQLAQAQFRIAINHLMTPIAKKMGLGYMDAAKMTLTRDVMTQYMKLTRVVPIEELYTNEFLPKLFPKMGS